MGGRLSFDIPLLARLSPFGSLQIRFRLHSCFAASLSVNSWCETGFLSFFAGSILTAFVGGRLYFEHLRRQEAKRKAEKTCRIPVPFGFGEVEVVEVLRPLVCPKDHRGYV